ncbi:hypothetical protein [Micromonospora sp. Llam0]|nr:hypothetical protein [Micromonospora sp. Llam0]
MIEQPVRLRRNHAWTGMGAIDLFSRNFPFFRKTVYLRDLIGQHDVR